jgi:hypothetical protein
MFAAAGMPIVEVRVYTGQPCRPQDDARVGTGHTMLGEPRPELGLSEIVMGMLPGQMASEMWLEHEGLLTPERRFLTQMASGPDHDAILAIDTPTPVAYLYGQARAPQGWTGWTIHIDALWSETRRRLAEAWPTVRNLSSQVGQVVASGSVGSGWVR